MEIEEGMELCQVCAAEEKEAARVQDPEACLVLEGGQLFSLDQEATLLGRSDPMEEINPDVDLSVYGGYEHGVSRRHAVIHREGESYSLEDLDSTNGTMVNRQKVLPGNPVNLVEGDVIHLGHLKAVFHVGTEQGGAS
jgi:pSer/pThr/pTyr-binding forkhead associated (FHA) protein